MSVQADISEFLTTLAKGATGQQVNITPDKIALQVGHSRDQVNKTLSNLATRDRIELVRGPNGRTITGYKLLTPPPDKRRTKHPGRVPSPIVAADEKAATSQQNGHAEPVSHTIRHIKRGRQVYTPLLDQYAEDKVKFERLLSEFGDRIEATFKEDPLAEEALLVKERLAILEESVGDYRSRAEEAEREVKALRTRHIQATTEKAMADGAMVQHSTD